MASEQGAIGPDTLNQGRDPPVLTDHRALLGGIVARQHGLATDRIATLFPRA